MTGSKLDLLADREKAKGWRLLSDEITQVDFAWTDLDEHHASIESPQELLLPLVGRRLAESPDRDLASIESGAVEFRPFQFRPLMKYLREPGKRLLIADETGLGKTIETAYILVEELAKNLLSRVLILCPSHLKDKWQHELSKRFGLHLDRVSGSTLLRLLQEERAFHAVASIDSMRGKEDRFRSTIAEMKAPLDFLVIDEIHHMIGRSGMTLRRELGRSLSLRAERMVGLSATPVQIEKEDLAKVLEIIDPANLPFERTLELLPVHEAVLEAAREVDPKGSSEGSDGDPFGEIEEACRRADSPMPERTEVFLERLRGDRGEDPTKGGIVQASPLAHRITRTRREEVGEKRGRRVDNVKIELDEDSESVWRDGEEIEVSEKDLFDRVEELLEQEFHFVHRRQLSSSLPGTLGLLRSGEEGHDRWVERLEGPDERSQEPSLTEDVRQECRTLRWQGKLLSGLDTKLQTLRDVLNRLEAQGARKAVVFTQWKPTIRYLEDRATSIDHPTFVIRGRDDVWDRQRTCELFAGSDGFAVLLSSDVIAEGIDLVAADAVVNYDLPMNPQKLSQRIGRIDRVSQPSDEVHVVNLLVEDGLDSEIHSSLHERLDAYRSTVGASPRVIEEGEDEALLEEADKVVELQSDAAGLDSALLDIDSGGFDERVLSKKEQARFVAPSDVRDLMLWVLEEWNTSPPSWVSRMGGDGLRIEDPPPNLPDALSSTLGHGSAGQTKQRLEHILERGGLRIGASETTQALVPIPVRHPLCQQLGRVASRMQTDQDGQPIVEIPVEEPPFGRFLLSRIELEWTDPLDRDGPRSTKDTWRALVEAGSTWEKLPIRRLFEGLRKTGAKVRSNPRARLEGAEAGKAQALDGSDWISMKKSEIRQQILQDIEDEVERLQVLVSEAHGDATELSGKLERLEEAKGMWGSKEADGRRIEVNREVLLLGKLVKKKDDPDG